MFQWFFNLFKKRDIKHISKDKMILVKDKDGRIRPVAKYKDGTVESLVFEKADELELIKHPDGSAELKIRGGA